MMNFSPINQVNLLFFSTVPLHAFLLPTAPAAVVHLKNSRTMSASVSARMPGLCTAQHARPSFLRRLSPRDQSGLTAAELRPVTTT